ncbi:MAG: dUTP diphosphatase [Acidobacteriaceae bacterium]
MQESLKVKLLHPDAKLPTVAHPGSDLGFDLYAVEDVVLEPGVPVKVRTGIAVEGPQGVGFILGDRSSMASKGITYMGGRIDAGYRGELLICLINVNQPVYTLQTTKSSAGVITDVALLKSDASIAIRKGDKIVQMSPLHAMTHWQIETVEELAASERNTKGFGSSGS